MKKRMLKSAIFSLVLASLFLASCSEDGLFSELQNGNIEDFVEESIYEIEERGNLGRFGCYELVFPVTLNFPDDTNVEVEDYSSLGSTIKDWKENNPNAEERPELAFPIEVMTETGELISVEDTEGLRELRQDCRRDRNRGRHGRCGKCFNLVFPLSIGFPDETTIEVADRRALKQALREWRRDNHGSEERPSFVFPIQIELTEDESIVDIATAEELAALREECRGGE